MCDNKKLVYGLSIVLLALMNAFVAKSQECEETWEDIRSMIVESASSTLIEKGKAKDTYAAWKVIDGDPGSAWVEGKNDEGIDEFLVFGWGFGDYIDILPGFARNEFLFKANNRPKDINIILVKVDSSYKILTLNDLKNDKVQILKDYNIKLNDERKYQKFELPGIDEIYNVFMSGKNFGKSLKLILMIKSVYKGLKDNDTCISEIRFINKKDGSDPIKEMRIRYKR